MAGTIPNGPLDTIPMQIDPGGQSASGILPSLQPLQDWFSKGGMTFNSGGVPTVLDPKTAPPSGQSGAAAGASVGGSLGSIFGPLGGAVGATVGGVGSAVGSATKNTVESFWNIPGRVGTVAVGLVFLSAGLYLLGKGPAVSIVTQAGKDLAVGA